MNASALQRYINEGLFHGSRWKCTHVEPLQKLGSKFSFAMYAVLDIEQSEIAAAGSGPAALIDLVSMPAARHEAEIARLRARVAVLEAQIKGATAALEGGSV